MMVLLASICIAAGLAALGIKIIDRINNDK